MPQSEKNVVNVVQIQCEGYNNKEVTVPVVAMKGQVDLHQYVDLLVPCPAKIKLLSGEGPIHLSGNHCVDYYGYQDQGEGEESEEEDGEIEEDSDKKEDLGNKLNKKESKKEEPKKDGEVEEEKVNEKELELAQKEEVAEENRCKKRKASADPTPEKEKIKTGSAEKKEKRKKSK